MSLYDGLGLDSKDKGHKDQKPDLTGWSSGIKLLQSQLQLKKAAMTQPRRDVGRKGSAIMAPVMDLKSRRDEPDEMPPPPAIFAQARVCASIYGLLYVPFLTYLHQTGSNYPRCLEELCICRSMVNGMSGSGSVAQRIMARYGYKQGQGLGKQEQGMSQALQVEKTSKRGGKIIHEKDIAKAVVDTNGRYFGGRIVKASFYDHDKFKRLELAE
ncbi:hypothetical protein V5799_029038 [Amblyomma americanum]|uniref:G-patch domain-containing protein n=1 Tax=Amblyomma americanum TaxID=6943 RepID=A0AAQ4ESM4_AMBAM